MRRQHSFQCDRHDKTLQEPKAIVVLLGWWGADTRHLDKYAQLYRDLNCLTVQAIADKMAVLTHDNASLDDCVLQWVATTASLLRQLQNPKIPLIVHAFSNGGAFMVERLEVLLEQGGNNHEDLGLVSQHLQGQVFDSSPAFPSMASAAEAMQPVFPNKLIKIIVLWLLQLHVILERIRSTVLGNKMYGQVFWEHMCDSQHCLQQAYIYSQSDTITNVDALEELIAGRQKRSDDIFVKKFADSLHVQHYRKHPEVYREFLKSFLLHVSSNTIQK